MSTLAHHPSPSQHAKQVLASTQPGDVLDFWRQAGIAKWFAKDDEFDQLFRERFMTLHEAATRGELDAWCDTAEGALALVILLDQFPRNAFRGTPRMYASDPQAVKVAEFAISRAFDTTADPAMSFFFYLPFGHAEDLRLQDRSVELSRPLGGIHHQHAQEHREIIRRFGRFPHRNAVLGRPMRPDEQRFLDEGGFAG